METVATASDHFSSVAQEAFAFLLADGFDLVAEGRTRSATS